MSTPCLASNPWITLGQNDTGQLEVTPIASPRQGNALSLDPDGFYVQGFKVASSAPQNPVAGDLWRYEFDSSPVVWSFVYRPGIGWCWKSGSELSDEVQTNGTRGPGGAGAVYGNLVAAGGGGVGPTIVLPFAGTYIIEHGARLNAGSNADAVWMSFDIGATGAVDANGITSGSTYSMNLSRRQTVAIATAGTQLQAKYKNMMAVSGGVDGQFASRWLTARPLVLA